MRQPTVRTAGTYVFSTFRLAADGTSLLREGTPVQLPPKVIQTLLALVRRAGDVVTKSELLDEVWPDSFVEETGVARNISMLRRALERDGDAITTVARIGYRFDSPVVYEAQRSTPPTSIGTSVARGQERQALFVGRDAEFAALLKAFISAERGMGRLVSVTGEAGIGKSTIVDHFLGAVRSRCHAGRGRSSRRFSNAEPHPGMSSPRKCYLACRTSGCRFGMMRERVPGRMGRCAAGYSQGVESSRPASRPRPRARPVTCRTGSLASPAPS